MTYKNLKILKPNFKPKIFGILDCNYHVITKDKELEIFFDLIANPKQVMIQK